MDVILDANAYIGVLHNHGRTFLQTNQFAELLTYLRRTGSRLVIPELTYNEVIARYRDRLTAVAKAARDSWSTLQQVGMNKRIDFIEPNINNELGELCELLNHPASGVQVTIYTDYSGVDVREVVQRGIGRRRPANEKGEELRDVILWLIVLDYAKQTKTPVAFVSGDKTFQDEEGALHPALRKDIERAQANITFYPLIRDFVKGNALEAEQIEQEALAAWVGPEELRGISTEQLLGSRFWWGTTVGAEVSRCELAEARRYRVGEDSYYVEARYTGEGIIRLSDHSFQLNNIGGVTAVPREPTAIFPYLNPNTTPIIAGPIDPMRPSSELIGTISGFTPRSIFAPRIPEPTEKSYKCSFSLRLSLRIAKGTREALEVDEFVLLGGLTPTAAGNS